MVVHDIRTLRMSSSTCTITVTVPGHLQGGFQPRDLVLRAMTWQY